MKMARLDEWDCWFSYQGPPDTDHVEITDELYDRLVAAEDEIKAVNRLIEATLVPDVDEKS